MYNCICVSSTTIEKKFELCLLLDISRMKFHRNVRNISQGTLNLWVSNTFVKFRHFSNMFQSKSMRKNNSDRTILWKIWMQTWANSTTFWNDTKKNSYFSNTAQKSVQLVDLEKCCVRVVVCQDRRRHSRDRALESYSLIFSHPIDFGTYIEDIGACLSTCLDSPRALYIVSAEIWRQGRT